MKDKAQSKQEQAKQAAINKIKQGTKKEAAKPKPNLKKGSGS